MAVRMRERAGLDYVSDGEWRRENYARVFADKVSGFRRQEVPRGRITLLAIVVDTMERRGDIVCRDAEFLRGLHIMMDAAHRMRADRLAMEFNSSAAVKLQPLRDFPADKTLGLGVVNPSVDSEVETAEKVIERVERALEFIQPERLTLNPDCGFATTASRASGFDLAYQKLIAMCSAAGSLRKKYG